MIPRAELQRLRVDEEDVEEKDAERALKTEMSKEMKEESDTRITRTYLHA